ncbi:DEAD/DEAH box helicase [Flavihumibacter sp. R14]|nr:DEAD/DEAH box helicase [Flavihumibacter soli]
MEKVLQALKIAALNEMQLASIDAPVEKDIVLLSPTGSGKTLAFLLPLFKQLNPGAQGIQSLILVPSRELALQIEQVFKSMQTGFKVNCFYGGHSTRVEKNNLSHLPAVLVGTPGRIAYHIRANSFDPGTITTMVLDEFDKSLEFGFEEDMAFIVSNLTALKKRVLTSATRMQEIPPFTGVKNNVVVDFLGDTNTLPDLQLKAVKSPAAADKLETLFSLICKIGSKPTLVFCNHREAVDRISQTLWDSGLEHDVFHGGLEQEDRELALLKFRNGSHRLLITTDLASRGLDIPEIEYVIHYQLPHTKEAFTHRNGRTARMNASGTAYLILAEDDKLPYLDTMPEAESVPEEDILPENTPWVTLYIAAGKKDKINKIDIVGLLLKKGDIQKEDLGRIEVWDFAAYAAIKRSKVHAVLARIKNEKIKNRKVKIEISR